MCATIGEWRASLVSARGLGDAYERGRGALRRTGIEMDASPSRQRAAVIRRPAISDLAGTYVVYFCLSDPIELVASVYNRAHPTKAIAHSGIFQLLESFPTKRDSTFQARFE